MLGHSNRRCHPYASPVILYLVLIFFCPALLAKGEYLSQEDFLAQAFSQSTPDMQQYYLKKPDKDIAKEILYHRFKPFRVRYWQQDERTAWILEEIGKEQLITIGVVIDNNEIERVRILTFRESRGWEVRFPAFTRQFEGAQLDDGQQLNKTINGITGATLSVTALRGVARLALYLHQQASNIEASE